MNNLLQKTASSEASTARLARLGTSHGYRFDGDNVHINAMFTVLNSAAHQRNWALQLWACPGAPRSASEISGQIVAEIPLPPIGEVADETESFDVSSIACTPAGRAEHVMVLALATGSEGKFDQVQDFAVYQNREQFTHPRMAGNVSFRVEGNRVTIEVERIENPRDAANISGTLALELWATDEPYRGGRFNGAPLAGVAIDPVSGQFEYRNSSIDLPFTPPAAGSWNVVLMLREWTANGFVTRDFTNFSMPMTIAAPVAKVAQPAAAAKAETVRVAAAKESKVPAKAQATASPASKPGAVSVNAATKAELAEIKGLPTKVAEGIVAKRPFKSLDDLLNVKGMGEKLLGKLRSKLKL